MTELSRIFPGDPGYLSPAPGEDPATWCSAFCPAEEFKGWVCSRSLEHEGDHAAHLNDDGWPRVPLVIRWPASALEAASDAVAAELRAAPPEVAVMAARLVDAERELAECRQRLFAPGLEHAVELLREKRQEEQASRPDAMDTAIALLLLALAETPEVGR